MNLLVTGLCKNSHSLMLNCKQKALFFTIKTIRAQKSLYFILVEKILMLYD